MRGEYKRDFLDNLHKYCDSDTVYEVQKYEDIIDLSVSEFLSHDDGALDPCRRLWNALRHYAPALYEVLPDNLTPNHYGYGMVALVAICGIIGVRTWE